MTRRYAAFFVTAVMILGLLSMLLSRPRASHDAPAEVIEPKTTPDAGAPAEAGALDASSSDAGAADVDAGAKSDERSMRVATLGWELAAPVAAADAGTFEVAPEGALDAVEARLARGGADPAGADVAILPLPAFVALYERLRVLEPRVFLVVGFSHGREEIHAAPGALTKLAPAADEVKLVAVAPSTATDATARSAGTESATLLGLFALDLVGVPPARVRIVAPGSDAAKGATVAAIARGATDERKLVLSTADASRLIPLVAVAPRAKLEESEARLRDWSRAWLDALARAGKDAPGVARRLAAKEDLTLAAGVGGAPDALALVERLGQILPATVADQAAVFAPGPASLEVVVQRTWQLARGGGLASIATPDPIPVDARVAKALAPVAPVRAVSDADAGVAATTPTGATLLLVYRAPADATVESVASQLAFVAGVFERAALRVTAKGGEKAARAIASQLVSKEGVAPSRVSVATGEPAGGAFATVEVLALP